MNNDITYLETNNLKGKGVGIKKALENPLGAMGG